MPCFESLVGSCSSVDFDIEMVKLLLVSVSVGLSPVLIINYFLHYYAI